MRIIDLSCPIYTGMSVYPGDPEVLIERVDTFERDQWNMARIHINTHDGTHVNVPIHATKDGKNLDDYPLEAFMGEAVLFSSEADIQRGIGVIFGDVNIDQALAELIVERQPKFVGLSDRFEFDIAVERFLLEAGVISFEHLANTEALPNHFIFYGAPLNLRKGDGSPVRAYAIVE